MKNTIFRTIYILLVISLLVSCKPSDKLWPSDKIGPMWVNRYGHTNAELIWNHCNGKMPATPGVETIECTVPWVDELFIGYGIWGVDKDQRDALWEARTWELSIDGYTVDLPAFNIADFDADLDGQTYQYRSWRIRLRKIPAGLHTLHYIMHVNQEIEGDPEAQSVGMYELVVNFTFPEK